MPDDPGILASIGFRVPSLFAGFAGGLVGAWADDKASLLTWITYAICAGLTANYLTAEAMHFLPSWISEGGTGFILGIGAPIVVKAIKGVINSWRPPQLKGGA